MNATTLAVCAPVGRPLSAHRLFPVVATILTIANPLNAATIIVGDGGSMQSAVASAQHGDVIEIQSNQTFVATLSWESKFLTIQAGDSYSPTIQGFPGDEAFRDIKGAPGEGAGALIRGLRLKAASDRAATITNVGESNVRFENSEFLGRVLLGGSSGRLNAAFEGCTFDSAFQLMNTSTAFSDVVLEANRFSANLRARALGGAGFNMRAVNNVFERGPNTNSGMAGISLSAQSDTPGQARFVNNTVVNYDFGLQVFNIFNDLDVTFENMLLANASDIPNFTFSEQASISNSLIADGTFAGASGNFQADPMFGPRFQLLPGSPGIDAGNNAAANIPLMDIAGNPRISDGNGDGLLRVDVGAYELIPEPSSAMVLAIGSLASLVHKRRRVVSS